ncbi:Gfo/Idh/MocA family oxidoreductase [Umezawaea sp. Da 62-37]|uniref:Gfo/Idh/MocA family protein n=1 Tax=Umezawaea sp. Da 62-37 TaxID=3075927 RepID=UPI0028F74184|nr:Gfo/Idh/MocA family oxidoreductase [Umezawaea sp. Da 62-37]WNV91695.1 Gfo/Idh/MocA family oxidoreductase [Umezawaea sp. Da 62-37]
MVGVEEQLRVGLVGAGPWATAVHAPGIADHPGTRLTSVWARRPEAAAEIAHAHGAEVASTPDELLSSVDAVAFAVPPEVQSVIAVKAAQQGKHVILEKPIAATVDEAELLVAAVEQAGVASLVLLTRRYAPETKELLTQLRRTGGWAGGDAQWLNGALLDGPYSHSPWRHERGALHDLGPHVFDLLDIALGTITDVVSATVSDTGLWRLVFAHDGGATSSAAMSMSMPLQPPVAELTVYGEHGYRRLSRGSTSARDCYTLLLDDFVAMIHSRTTEHPLDVRRGLHLQRVIELAASKAGR